MNSADGEDRAGSGAEGPVGGEVLLSCRGLVVRRGRRTVLDDVALDLADGEVVALLGPNGAGKSTLLDTLSGGLSPSAGTIDRRARIAVALQSPDLMRGSVLTNVMRALSWWGVPRGERRARALAALAAIGAEHLAGRAAAELSGGERRRVHLARVLALRPGVLMLDEPFAGLDGSARATLLEETGAALRNAAGAALVVVHDRAEAWALADRLIVLLDGRIAADGPPRELLSTPPSRAVARFLGFDGELAQPDGGTLLTRPQHVVLDPDGPLSAEVVQLVPTEDAMRLELRLTEGRVHCVAPLPGPGRGEQVGVRITGGVRFTQGEGEPTVAPAPVQPDSP